MSTILSGGVLFAYAEAYLDATKRLISIENRKFREGDWNIFVMPLLFLFRHYLELGLKACICMKREIEILEAVSQPDISREKLLRAQKNLDERLKCIHDLSKLIKDMKGYFPGNEGFFSERVQSYLNRLSKYDKKSDVFRYPFGTKGNWLLSGQPIMPMEEIKKMVREISHELNSIAVQLIENLNLLHESKLTNPE